jgi:hypothetical protein
MQTMERFWLRCEVDGECLVWTGCRDAKGYARIGDTRAHRVAYELAAGPIPEGLHIDHLCGNRACVNPNHLEAVTIAENNRRAGRRNQARPSCKRGHPWPENLRYRKTGHAECAECQREHYRAYCQRKKGAA